MEKSLPCDLVPPCDPAAGLLDNREASSIIVAEARENPELLHAAPLTAPLRRLDEVKAARDPVLRYAPPE